MSAHKPPQRKTIAVGTPRAKNFDRREVCEDCTAKELRDMGGNLAQLSVGEASVDAQYGDVRLHTTITGYNVCGYCHPDLPPHLGIGTFNQPDEAVMGLEPAEARRLASELLDAAAESERRRNVGAA
jgi:hypothetical protein